jgi:DNA polymerase-3 subunit epsilon
VQPCHRALPDAQATAEVLLALIGLAQERGARTVAELVALSATRTRRVFDKRHLAFGAPPRPGVYRFYDRNGQLLYVGRARDLRARLRSYFRSDRQRPAVEAALAAGERIEWRVLGSELEAALEELRLIRELRPAANVRSARPDRYVYLRRRGETGGAGSTEPGISVVCSQQPGPLGPLKSRSRARLAARALESAGTLDPDEALATLRERRAWHATCKHAACERDRVDDGRGEP